MSDTTIRRDESLLCGRLVALPSSTTTAQLKDIESHRGFANTISIDFPAMPDTIELARSTDYAVVSNLVVPDGVHQYRSTKPLEIPVSFKIHAMDKQYCKKGALTLLQLAARLHSFVLPISTFSRGFTIAPTASSTESKPGDGKKADANLQAAAGTSQEQGYSVVGANNSTVGGIFSPVTCWLHLMWTTNDGPGISAVGYVREVKVVFNGPWLRGPGSSFNLPTSADFSFVFIHRPGHNNNLATTSSKFPDTNANASHAFADDVKDKFYNTRDLVVAANYQGFSTNPSGQTS